MGLQIKEQRETMDQSGSKRGILFGALCIILGLVAGFGLGLLLSRGIKSPCRSSEALARLGADSKEEYAVLVAAAYSQDQDLARAQAQLERLGVSNPNLWIAALLESSLDGGRDASDMYALAQLAQGLGVESQAVLAYQATATAAAPSDTPPPSPTTVPSLTASPTAVPVDTAPPVDTAQPVDTTPPVPTDAPLPLDLRAGDSLHQLRLMSAAYHRLLIHTLRRPPRRHRQPPHPPSGRGQPG